MRVRIFSCDAIWQLSCTATYQNSSFLPQISTSLRRASCFHTSFRAACFLIAVSLLRYMDLGSYYVDGYKLPPEYQYTLTKQRFVQGDNGDPIM